MLYNKRILKALESIHLFEKTFILRDIEK